MNECTFSAVKVFWYFEHHKNVLQFKSRRTVHEDIAKFAGISEKSVKAGIKELESRNPPLISVDDDNRGVVYNLEGSKRSREEIKKIQEKKKETVSRTTDSRSQGEPTRRRGY